MSKLKLVYPEALTNAVWQSKKGLTTGSTGIGKLLLKLEHDFKASPFDDGLNVNHLVVADPVQTLDTLKKLSSELERLGKPLSTSINAVRKQVLESLQIPKLKTKDAKAFQHLKEMEEALDTLEKEIERFFSMACSSAHEAFLEARKHSKSSEALMEVGEQAETLLKVISSDRARAAKAKTPSELRIAMILNAIGKSLLELTQLWNLAIREHSMLVKKLNSPVGSEGAAYARIEKLTMLSDHAYQNDTLLRITLHELVEGYLKRHPNAQELDAVQHYAKAFVEALNEAEKVLEEIVAVWEGAEKAARRIAKLGTTSDD